jgi:hypothetical protein
MTTSLLPCPFCGGPATLGVFPKGIIGQVYCKNEDCFGPRTTALTKQESIIQWNARPEQSTPSLDESAIRRDEREKCAAIAEWEGYATTGRQIASFIRAGRKA